MSRRDTTLARAAAACSGKHRYPNYITAADASLRSNRPKRGRSRDGRPIEVYRCPACKGYHLGHVSEQKPRRGDARLDRKHTRARIRQAED